MSGSGPGDEHGNDAERKMIVVLRRKIMVAKAKGDRAVVASLTRKLESRQEQILRRQEEQAQHELYNQSSLPPETASRKRNRNTGGSNKRRKSKRSKGLASGASSASSDNTSSAPGPFGASGAAGGASSSSSSSSSFSSSSSSSFSSSMSKKKKGKAKVVDSDNADSLLLSSILHQKDTAMTQTGADLAVGSFASGAFNTKTKPLKKQRVMRKDSELLVAGESLTVAPANLVTFTALIEQRWFGEGVRSQVEAFKEGLEEVVSLDSLRIFTASELRSLFCGDSEVVWDADLLSKEVLVPTGSMTHDTNLFRFLVAELVAMENRDRIRFLEFTTAIPRLIPGTKIAVSRQHGPTPMNLPTARTCSYQLNLPAYKTQAELGQKLRDAVSNGLKSGFHENASTRLRGISVFSPNVSRAASPSASPRAGSATAVGSSSSSSLSSTSTSSSLSMSAATASAAASQSVSSSSSFSSGSSGSSLPSSMGSHPRPTNGVGYELKFSRADIGAIVMVQWTQNVSQPQWFQGVVQRYEAGRGHYVLYPEDGDMQWHNFGSYRYHVIKPPVPGAANAADATDD